MKQVILESKVEQVKKSNQIVKKSSQKANSDIQDNVEDKIEKKVEEVKIDLVEPEKEVETTKEDSNSNINKLTFN